MQIMKKLLLAIGVVAQLAFIGGCVSTSEFGSTDFVVRHDDGGNVEQYKAKAQTLKGKRIVVDGRCYSSCLFYLSSFSSGTYCATEKADLGFHSIYFVRTDNGVVLKGSKYEEASKASTNAFLNSLTPKLRGYYKGKRIPSVYEGDEPTTVSHLKGKKAIELLGAC